MFLIMGVSNGEKLLNYNQNLICPHCGRLTNITVYMTYMSFYLFFIPIFKWNRKYYIRTNCCGADAELDPNVGKAIARGEDVYIKAENLYFYDSYSYNMPKCCSKCGYTTMEDFQFCPKCGNRM